MYLWFCIFRESIQQNLKLFCLVLHKSKRENIFCFSFCAKDLQRGTENIHFYASKISGDKTTFFTGKSMLFSFCKPNTNQNQLKITSTSGITWVELVATEMQSIKLCLRVKNATICCQREGSGSACSSSDEPFFAQCFCFGPTEPWLELVLPPRLAREYRSVLFPKM